MSNARLTRQEVGWLLAQEARGAASALRRSVSQLAVGEVEIRSGEDAPLTTTLDVLDDAINLWSELDHSPSTRGRRGRIDVAALLYDLAPNARIAIQPGEGTEIFAEESDLRRLLSVLVSHRGAGAGPEAGVGGIDVRREGAWIRVSVDLGPDLSASEDLERRWLSRMATRLGGRVELVGSTETLILPADASSDHVEVENLRRELREAQELGETYARELAAVFADVNATPAPRSLSSLPPAGPSSLETLASLASVLVRAFRPLFGRVREASGGVEGALSDVANAGLDLLADLEQIASLPLPEGAEDIDVQNVVRSASEACEARAGERRVSVEVRSAPLRAWARPGYLRLSISALLSHGIAATPRGGRVAVHVTREGDDLVVAVEDGGPAIPPAAGSDVLQEHVDPTSFGRPGGVALAIARAVTASQDGALSLDESPAGSTRITARIPSRNASRG